MEIKHCAVPFVGGGYNRILLAFSSLLCGQMHLNVSSVSCLFRNGLEIGNTNASQAPITYRRLGLFFTAHCLHWTLMDHIQIMPVIQG